MTEKKKLEIASTFNASLRISLPVDKVEPKDKLGCD